MTFIATQGVKHIFMLSGGGAMHLDDSLGQCPDLTYICCLHEQACAIAAEAYSKQTGSLGVALVTTGPGGTNAITGVAGAWLDSTPMLVISGQVKRADLKGHSGVRQLGVQEVDIVSIVSTITKAAVTITDPETIRYHLERAAALARRGRPGPVWLDIPLDVQAATLDPASLKGFEQSEWPETGRPIDLPKSVARVVELLKSAARPVILVGNGVRLAGGYAVLQQVLAEIPVPVLVATSLGIDLVAEDHPRFFGRPGPIAPRYANFTLQNCDLLISVGARLDMAMTGYSHQRFARAAKKVQVDIDAAELAKMQTRIDLPIRVDAAVFLTELLSQVQATAVPRFSDWIDRCRQWKARYPVVLDEFRERQELVSLYHFTDVLCDHLASDEVVVACSSGNAVELFHLVYKAKAGQRVIHTRGLGAMGFGLPAAMGAKVARPEALVVDIDGDGSILMNIQELATCRTEDIPVKVLLLNNQHLGMVVQWEDRFFKGNRAHTYLGPVDHPEAVGRGDGISPDDRYPDFVAIAHGFGWQAETIVEQKDLVPSLERLIDAPGPALLDVQVPYQEHVLPMIPSGGTVRDLIKH